MAINHSWQKIAENLCVDGCFVWNYLYPYNNFMISCERDSGNIITILKRDDDDILIMMARWAPRKKAKNN